MLKTGDRVLVDTKNDRQFFGTVVRIATNQSTFADKGDVIVLPDGETGMGFVAPHRVHPILPNGQSAQTLTAHLENAIEKTLHNIGPKRRDKCIYAEQISAAIVEGIQAALENRPPNSGPHTAKQRFICSEVYAITQNLACPVAVTSSSEPW